MPLSSNSIKYNSTALSEYMYLSTEVHTILSFILNILLFLKNEVMTPSQISTLT